MYAHKSNTHMWNNNVSNTLNGLWQVMMAFNEIHTKQPFQYYCVCEKWHNLMYFPNKSHTRHSLVCDVSLQEYIFHFWFYVESIFRWRRGSAVGNQRWHEGLPQGVLGVGVPSCSSQTKRQTPVSELTTVSSVSSLGPLLYFYSIPWKCRVISACENYIWLFWL